MRIPPAYYCECYNGGHEAGVGYVLKISPPRKKVVRATFCVNCAKEHKRKQGKPTLQGVKI